MTIVVGKGINPVVSVDGDIDYSNSAELRKTVQQLLDSGCSDIGIDLSGVDFIDSSGVRVLMEYARPGREQQERRLRLLSASPSVYRTLHKLGIAEILGATGDLIIEKSPARTSPESSGRWLLSSLTLPLTPSSPHLVRERIDQVIADLPFTNTERMDIKLAVGEAIANAVRHGSPGGTGTITMRCSADAEKLVIEISDSGLGFDPKSVCPPDFQTLPTGGMGIAIMGMIMDEVSFDCSCGTTVRMVKCLPR